MVRFLTGAILAWGIWWPLKDASLQGGGEFGRVWQTRIGGTVPLYSFGAGNRLRDAEMFRRAVSYYLVREKLGCQHEAGRFKLRRKQECLSAHCLFSRFYWR